MTPTIQNNYVVQDRELRDVDVVTQKTRQLVAALNDQQRELMLSYFAHKLRRRPVSLEHISQMLNSLRGDVGGVDIGSMSVPVAMAILDKACDQMWYALPADDRLLRLRAVK